MTERDAMTPSEQLREWAAIQDELGHDLSTVSIYVARKTAFEDAAEVAEAYEAKVQALLKSIARYDYQGDFVDRGRFKAAVDALDLGRS